ncbi:hypothetical protein HK101_004342 [Irineochytrium annulatum]|nr:hypothetical protein HK101_004342 [Irineochytrium annulatum]
MVTDNELEGLLRPQLQKLAKEMGLSATGKKVDLIARIQEARSQPAAGAPGTAADDDEESGDDNADARTDIVAAVVEREDLENLTRPQLQKKAKSLALPATGKKVELIERILEALSLKDLSDDEQEDEMEEQGVEGRSNNSRDDGDDSSLGMEEQIDGLSLHDEAGGDREEPAEALVAYLARVNGAEDEGSVGEEGDKERGVEEGQLVINVDDDEDVTDDEVEQEEDEENCMTEDESESEEIEQEGNGEVEIDAQVMGKKDVVCEEEAELEEGEIHEDAEDADASYEISISERGVNDSKGFFDDYSSEARDSEARDPIGQPFSSGHEITSDRDDYDDQMPDNPELPEASDFEDNEDDDLELSKHHQKLPVTSDFDAQDHDNDKLEPLQNRKRSVNAATSPMQQPGTRRSTTPMETESGFTFIQDTGCRDTQTEFFCSVHRRVVTDDPIADGSGVAVLRGAVVYLFDKRSQKEHPLRVAVACDEEATAENTLPFGYMDNLVCLACVDRNRAMGLFHM